MPVTVHALADAVPVEEGSSFPVGAVLMGAVAMAFLAALFYLLRKGSSREKLSWRAAYGWAFVIFVFFMLSTTWFPSWLISQQFVATAPGWVSDLVGSGAWFVPLAAGLVGLRMLQKAGRI